MPLTSRPPSSSPDHGGPSAPRTARPWVWTAAGGGLAAALMALVAAGWSPLLTLDARVARSLHDVALAHPDWTRVARFLTDWVWDTVTMRTLAAVVFVVLWRRGEQVVAFCLAVAVLLGVVVQQGLKAALDRERPQWREPVDAAHYAAMPSGHALTAALVCGLLVWLVWDHTSRRSVRGAAAAAAVVSVVGVSFTRVHLGVHWLTDVVAGAALGVAMAALAAGCCRLLRGGGRIPA